MAECSICGAWSRMGSEWMDTHAASCPHNPIRLLKALVNGIRRWAAEEDGVPDWLWEEYLTACELVRERESIKHM